MRTSTMSPRKTAATVGILYIVGTVAGVLSVVFTQPVLSASDLLSAAGAQGGQMSLGALLVLTMAFSLAFIPVLMYPILKPHSARLAVGYVVFRGAIETVSVFISVIGFLLLPVLGRALAAGAVDAAGAGAAGVLLRGMSNLPITVFSFGIGAVILYCALYQTRLLPRWLSVWGLVAIALHIVTGLLQMFGLLSSFDTLNTALNFPIFLQEMVMAVWLIAKGFNPNAIKEAV